MKDKSLNKKNVKYIDPKTHTHTLNKSNQFYISKNKLRQFSEHLLTHVFLVMAKSQPTHVSKVAKSLRVVCENIVRVYKCLIL